MAGNATPALQADAARRALFIVFEGIDGSGTTTQSALLVAHIRAMGVDVVHTREPGGTALGERIRDVYLDPEVGDLDGMTEMLLCAASRHHHVQTHILPSLDCHKPVICARYTASSVAYQGYGRGLCLEDVTVLNQMATMNCRADLTFFLDLPLAAANKRVQERPINADRMDSEADDFKTRVVDAYRHVAALEPECSIVVDGTEPEERIAEKVRSELVTRWPAFPFREQ
jgi:dTMP kinase